jgi:hypothetical protein
MRLSESKLLAACGPFKGCVATRCGRMAMITATIRPSSKEYRSASGQTRAGRGLYAHIVNLARVRAGVT